MVIIAPSILAANPAKLAEGAKKAEENGADWLHLDVMDGVFVPQITFGAATVAAIRKETKLFLDAHLMIQEPEKHVESFAKAGADMITIHLEATKDARGVLEKIKALGKKAGVSIKPKTPLSALSAAVLDAADLVLIMTVEPGFGGQKFMPDMMDKVQALEKRFGASKLVEVDGGINDETAPTAVRAGADVLVAGTAVYGAPDMRAAIRKMKELK